MSSWRFFKASFVTSLVGLGLAFWLGFHAGGWAGGLQLLILTLALALLEISISFDNAIVNATVLRGMNPLWRRRFLTWGMVIAVFGMRLIFPLAIVAIFAGLGPFETLRLALADPVRYAEILTSFHLPIAAFGGSFLLLVALRYFFNAEKKVHWIRSIEEPLAQMGKLEAVEIGISLCVLLVLASQVPRAQGASVFVAGIAGILTNLAIEGLSVFLKRPATDAAGSSWALFIYLEVLDASFSFDGVVGSFAITNNLLVIFIGLGIGALFVRSLTIMMVERQILERFRYLENGAFFSIAALACLMLVSPLYPVPELVTGSVGALLIGLSLVSSFRVGT